MKIVNIFLTSQNGGAEQVFIDYCEILKKNLHHEVFAIIKDDAPYFSELERLNIKFKTTKNNFGFYDFFAINNIKKYLEECNADLVIAHSGRSTSLARKAIKKIKKKILIASVNHSMNVKRSIGCDIIISVNKPIFYRTIDLGQSENKSFVVPNAIDLTDFKPYKPNIDLAKKDTIIIGSIGRFDKIKGFNEAIELIKSLENSPQKFILKIAGDGEEMHNLRALAKNLKIEKNIEFLGWIKNKKEFFDSIDIFLLPSLRETFGLVILEAMKYGKPIVSSDADGPKEIIRDHQDGIIVKRNGDLENYKKAITKIISTPNLANNLVENAFNTLQNKFSFQSIKLKLEDIFGKNSN